MQCESTISCCTLLEVKDSINQFVQVIEELKYKRKVCEDQQKEIQNLLQEKLNLEDEKHSFAIKLTTANNRIKKLNDELDYKKLNNSDLKSETDCKDLQHQLQTSNAVVAGLKKELCELHMSNHQKKLSLEKSEQKFKTLENSHAFMKEKFETLQKQAKILSQTQKHLKEVHSNLTLNLDAVKDINGKLNIKLKHKNCIISDLKSTKTQLDIKIIKLESEISKLNSKLSNMNNTPLILTKQELEDAKEQNDCLKTGINTINEQLKLTESSLQAMTESNKAAHGLLLNQVGLEENIDNLTEELKAKDANLCEISKKLETAEANVHQKELTDKLDEKEMVLKELESENVAYKSSTNELKSQLDNMQQKYKSLKEDCDQLTDQIKELQEKSSSIESFNVETQTIAKEKPVLTDQSVSCCIIQHSDDNYVNKLIKDQSLPIKNEQIKIIQCDENGLHNKGQGAPAPCQDADNSCYHTPCNSPMKSEFDIKSILFTDALKTDNTFQTQQSNSQLLVNNIGMFQNTNIQPTVGFSEKMVDLIKIYPQDESKEHIDSRMLCSRFASQVFQGEHPMNNELDESLNNLLPPTQFKSTDVCTKKQFSDAINEDKNKLEFHENVAPKDLCVNSQLQSPYSNKQNVPGNSGITIIPNSPEEIKNNFIKEETQFNTGNHSINKDVAHTTQKSSDYLAPDLNLSESMPNFPINDPKNQSTGKVTVFPNSPDIGKVNPVRNSARSPFVISRKSQDENSVNIKVAVVSPCIKTKRPNSTSNLIFPSLSKQKINKPKIIPLFQNKTFQATDSTTNSSESQSQKNVQSEATKKKCKKRKLSSTPPVMEDLEPLTQTQESQVEFKKKSSLNSVSKFSKDLKPPTIRRRHSDSFTHRYMNVDPIKIDDVSDASDNEFVI